MRSLVTHTAALTTGVALAAAGVAVAAPRSHTETPGLSGQIAQLRAEIATLQTFDKQCLRRIHLSQSPQGWMVWDKTGASSSITPYAGTFYGMPDTAVPPLVCFAP